MIRTMMMPPRKPDSAIFDQAGKIHVAASESTVYQVLFDLAELTEKTTQGDRIQILKASQAMLKEFISFVKPWSFCLTKSYKCLLQVVLILSKILGRKRERKDEAGQLERQQYLLLWRREENVLDDDGEEEREAWLTTISLALCKAFDLLEMLSAVNAKKLQEGDKEVSQAILDERAKKAEAWHRDADARARFSKSAAPITCVTFAQDVIEGRKEVSDTHEHKHQPIIFGPASLMVMGKNPTSERERLAAQVFQPQYGLPTISIEEAGLREMEMMNKWQERNAKLMEEANSSWYKDNQMLRPDEEEDDDDEAAQDWARQWDDWKDDNPRGAGNKKLAPCG
ncbi:hypothetical protein ACH5RR_017251 [Cinchona calisaya]|uniref:PP2A regulatory subunit TAP46 n=1 Tax=Cinchona calisaya TaxID=153742 RepID=A0ABD3A1W4_9GENT